jgi:hypothetical protein
VRVQPEPDRGRVVSRADTVLAAVEACQNTYRLAAEGGFDQSGGVYGTLSNIAMGMLAGPVLDEAALVWVSSPMTDLVLHSAESLEPYDFDPFALPWPSALCVFDRPIFTVSHPDDPGKQVDIRAVQWLRVRELAGVANCCMVVGLANYHGPTLLSPFTVTTLTPGSSWSRKAADGGSPLDQPTDQVVAFGKIMCSLWLLVQQRVAVRGTAPIDRSTRRRWGRQRPNDPIPDVTVVELRRPISSPKAGEQREVDWSHRWIVDGHWRNQYHPTTDSHVPTWIAPYVKGPEDKPLAMKRKIQAWVR